uniref:Uncharacterized protein n=1 Tax=Cacopsylla melanoneura TaxID=428564 RepID=A0A8D8WEI8_9HEMI
MRAVVWEIHGTTALAARMFTNVGLLDCLFPICYTFFLNISTAMNMMYLHRILYTLVGISWWDGGWIVKNGTGIVVEWYRESRRHERFLIKLFSTRNLNLNKR